MLLANAIIEALRDAKDISKAYYINGAIARGGASDLKYHITINRKPTHDKPIRKIYFKIIIECPKHASPTLSFWHGINYENDVLNKESHYLSESYPLHELDTFFQTITNAMREHI